MMANWEPRYPLIGIAGWSGSGKTTLLEKILPLLSLMGLKVNVIKASHHDVTFEPPHKDSSRLRRAGAAEVMLATPYRYMLVREIRNEVQPALKDLVRRLSPADLILVEGYRDEKIPKLEVWRPETGKPALYLTDPDVKAVASDVPRPDGVPETLDWLDLNSEARVADWILNRPRTEIA